MKKLLGLMFFVIIGIFAAHRATAVTLNECAADTQLSRFGTYHNGTTGVNDSNVLEWEIGSGQTYSNIQGISAISMPRAYQRFPDSAYLTAANGTVLVLLARYASDPGLPYAPDVVLLKDMCTIGATPSYCTSATALYARVTTTYSATANADRYITNRLSLAGWDVAWHIAAAQASGNTAYAQAMASRIMARRADWEHALYGGFDYTGISRAALTWAISGLPGSTMKDLAKNLAVQVAAAQLPDGSWEEDFQTTAYGLLGLKAVGQGSLYANALGSGVFYLQSTATNAPSCGWSYPPEYGEVNGEVIMALSLIGTQVPALPYALPIARTATLPARPSAKPN